ncbi:FAD-dependent oxidoreductase, partial [Escherichia coli]
LMIATGSVPSIPPIEGLDGVEYWTNRGATSVREIPESVVVLGAGPVGCELAQFFARMGAKVALADIADRLLPRDHPDAGALLH